MHGQQVGFLHPTIPNNYKFFKWLMPSRPGDWDRAPARLQGAGLSKVRGVEPTPLSANQIFNINFIN